MLRVTKSNRMSGDAVRAGRRYACRFGVRDLPPKAADTRRLETGRYVRELPPRATGTLDHVPALVVIRPSACVTQNCVTQICVTEVAALVARARGAATGLQPAARAARPGFRLETTRVPPSRFESTPRIPWT